MSKPKKKTKKKKKLNDRKFNNEIIGSAVIGFGIISLISLFSFKMGIIGSIIRGTTFSLMGFGGYFFPIVIIGMGYILISDRFDDKENKKILSLLSILLIFLVMLDGPNMELKNFIDRIQFASTLSLVNKGGGIIGAFLGFFFYKLFGPIGGYLVLSLMLFITILMFTEIEIKDIYNNLKLSIKMKETTKKPRKENKKNKDISIDSKSNDIRIVDYSSNQNKVINVDFSNENKTTNETKETKEVGNIDAEIQESKSKIQNTVYSTPPISLLNSPKTNQGPDDKKEILNNAKIIEETMKNFGIDATITQINRGPTITCYELSPEPGIKLSKIVSLSDNIALSLASSDIRIEAPIPGKAAVGIEVPNKNKDNVYLKEILLSDQYINIDSNIPLSLGKDVTGKPIISAIDKMPHLLIAGATGSGKSVCINTIIMSIIYKSPPDDVKLLLIDPKIVELSIYNEIPHLLIPVVTDAKKAAFALNWAVEEMERRYKLFAQNSVRDISSYNNKGKTKDLEKLPTIVIIIDELADLMMVAAQEIEDYICRLAQMARAAGMYLIVATQRPSVDVITGTIKANIPSRISFAVSSQVDSRTILDMGGAEKLLGKGDMLFHPSFYSKPLRVQGAFISDSEVESVVNFLKQNNSSDYDEDIVEIVQNSKDIDLDDGDELLPDAIELVVEDGQASISMLQRRLRIGYARAARIIDELELRGIVGGYEGSKPRKVLITKEDLEDSNSL
ncbi:DNA translocase FtsK 4TM domain-containing protein [Tissierellaceae bacterium HCP3S3_D8]